MENAGKGFSFLRLCSKIEIIHMVRSPGINYSRGEGYGMVYLPGYNGCVRMLHGDLVPFGLDAALGGRDSGAVRRSRRACRSPKISVASGTGADKMPADFGRV